ncbi:HSP20-like chaperone, partial [Ramaria rubella]
RVNFKDSADGKTVTATFELTGVNKSDVHVSYQNDKVVISWETVTTDERTEGERLIRERKEKKYVRTLPLPDGTKFEEVKASMDGRHLVLTYPRFTPRKNVQPIEIKSE